MQKCTFLLLLLIASSAYARAQHLRFTHPTRVLGEATTDKAISLMHCKKDFLVSWKAPGNAAEIFTGYVDQQHPELTTRMARLDGAISSFGPAFAASDSSVYLFWIGTDSTIKYAMGIADSSFAGATVKSLPQKGQGSFALGLNAAFVDGRMVIATHVAYKAKMALLVCDLAADGSISQVHTRHMAMASTDDFPNVIAVTNNKVARVSWKGRKNNPIYYADYRPDNNSWLPPQPLMGATTQTVPAMYKMPAQPQVFYIWKGRAANGSLRYNEETDDEVTTAEATLPATFHTNLPVTLSRVDDDNFVMGFVGEDQQLYLSYCASYNPASWMADLLMPEKGNYTLKDIVIPGAHDAGMSVLTAVGGKGGRTINECNTLTQFQSVRGQLNSGIRMFDLRIDQYQGRLHTKHAPSDCMEDAIAGGYGEPLDSILLAVRQFLDTNREEIVVLSFCHFCDRNQSLDQQARFISETLGADKVYNAQGKQIGNILLKDLAGKVLLTFENIAFPERGVAENTMGPASSSFLNYRREYAATNKPEKLVAAQKAFFMGLRKDVAPNDLIRLDWQLTEASQEAVMICNDFEVQKSNPLLDGVILLANVVNKSKSILDLSYMGSRQLPGSVEQWIEEGIINNTNKPNILYVDVAGAWITDFCIDLNKMQVYQK